MFLIGRRNSFLKTCACTQAHIIRSEGIKINKVSFVTFKKVNSRSKINGLRKISNNSKKN
ncbi:hypothetical protein WN51_10862 [Melipona quadrifasciata]|uniref:Uncharacterized protein n=1 Tax=Melipona quadrifasciata TaxID=166423 RepID=A0A0M9A653_9HYME|nr:hypothetical protein WN51_10862 [Melipona quadrifasciata]